ncbi:MAG: Ig-like domain-containing protein [Cyclobacteriaceae bacterium]|nr:Ig-like domain-containing protein [Cyclobacteriaceae bacterium]
MKVYKLTFLLIPLLFWACANRVPPTGGPKDTDPPKLLGSIPKNGSTNVRTREITLLFDEQVVLKNIKKELLITPRIESDYTYKTKKNTIILNLEEPLDSATTYTFNFREGVVDITEGNPAQDLILAFSTGNILDTLQIKGQVTDLFTEKPQEDVIVGLYVATDTLDLFNSPPYYLAQTNKQGEYTFRNLKASSYKIFAFDDKNNNLTCQSDRESYAFLDSLIVLDSNYVARPLRLQTLNVDTLQLKRTRSSGHYFYVIPNKGLVSATIKAANDSTLWYSYGEGRKEIKLYNTFPINDSLLVNLSMTDSIYQTSIDSFYLSFPETQRSYDPYEAKVTNLIVSPEIKQVRFSVTATKPILKLLTDSIHIALDTLLQIPFDSTWNITPNETSTHFDFKNTLPNVYLDSIGQNTLQTDKSSAKRGFTIPDKQNTKPKSTAVYSLVFPKATFLSIEKDSSKHSVIQLKPRYSKDFGILAGSITTDKPHFTVQLLTKDYKVVDEKIDPGKSYKFTYVDPGDYFLRILIDENNNGRWDPGNILRDELPEPIFIYKDSEGTSKTTIRANWELTFDLSF